AHRARCALRGGEQLTERRSHDLLAAKPLAKGPGRPGGARRRGIPVGVEYPRGQFGAPAAGISSPVQSLALRHWRGVEFAVTGVVHRLKILTRQAVTPDSVGQGLNTGMLTQRAVSINLVERLA